MYVCMYVIEKELHILPIYEYEHPMDGGYLEQGRVLTCSPSAAGNTMAAMDTILPGEVSRSSDLAANHSKEVPRDKCMYECMHVHRKDKDTFILHSYRQYMHIHL